ncbi:hypothetical protein Taro_003433 [Colocasia esculenta]|uniref:Uncharacterized protein n=1 Tax=Colocasia esculenta TaxID=4460 RepID=A0A843TH68_COLES|nr:hypothetical protein [Colocasia esculenta]
MAAKAHAKGAWARLDPLGLSPMFPLPSVSSPLALPLPPRHLPVHPLPRTPSSLFRKPLRDPLPCSLSPFLPEALRIPLPRSLFPFLRDTALRESPPPPFPPYAFPPPIPESLCRCTIPALPHSRARGPPRRKRQGLLRTLPPRRTGLTANSPPRQTPKPQESVCFFPLRAVRTGRPPRAIASTRLPRAVAASDPHSTPRSSCASHASDACRLAAPPPTVSDFSADAPAAWLLSGSPSCRES